MRRPWFGLTLVSVALVGACAAQNEEPRQLAPLPGVTTASTLVAASTTVDPTATTTTVTDVLPTTSSTVAVAGWPFDDFRSVFRLGGQTVVGSGCGTTGGVGEVIPDGWWLGIITADGSSQLQVDLVCAYSDAEAEPLIEACLGSDAAATCTDYFDESFWPENFNARERTVPKSSALVTESSGDLCDVGVETRPGGITGELDWLQILDGSVVYIRQGCGD